MYVVQICRRANPSREQGIVKVWPKKEIHGQALFPIRALFGKMWWV
jgi:hypothetical protein